MLRLSKLITWAAAVAAVSMALISCGGGGGGGTAVPAAPTGPAYVSGKVQTSDGAGLAGAAVLAAGQTAVTGSDGSYKFEAAAGDTTVILVKKTGYTTTAKEVPLQQGVTTQLDIKLFVDQVSTTFSANAPADITVSGANVKIPANAVQTASGAAYNGTVSMAASYYSPDTVQGAQAFAGPYTGSDSGAQSPIISMGFVEVKLSDAAGNPLQLKAGSPATLTFPTSSNTGTATSVPLWFYDEAALVWKREGDATRQTDGSFQGTVKHFTLWNADFQGLTATIKGCFRDAAGQPVSNVGFTGLRGTGWSHLISGNNPDGNFQIVLVPANMPLELFSAVSPASFASVAIPALTPGEVRQLPCIKATYSSSTLIVAPSTPFATTTVPAGTGTAAYAGNYSGTYSGVENGTFSVVVSAAGYVSGTNYSTTYKQTFLVSGQVSADGTLSLTAAAGTAGSGQFKGTISPTGAVSGDWNYEGSQLGGTFTGQRI
jgi:Carboxypeptidase regulatory-like domain